MCRSPCQKVVITLLRYLFLLTSRGIDRCEAFSIRHRQELRSRLEARVSQASEPLRPEGNPQNEMNARTSLGGVRYGDVASALDVWFPPDLLENRTALSRKDGYWKYIRSGQDAPLSLTYGEFDCLYFADLLDRSRAYYEPTADIEKQSKTWEDRVFVDLGSGVGRLVFAAAALHPNWKMARGIEVLPTIHNAAMETLEKCGSQLTFQNEVVDQDERSSSSSLQLSPIEFLCASFDDPEVQLGDADCIFVFSTCMSSQLMETIAQSIGRQCRPGTVVITIDSEIPTEGILSGDDDETERRFQFQLMESMDGWCWITGGESTAYLYKVVQSQWSLQDATSKRRESSREILCFRAVKKAEAERDYKRFLVGVYNNMVFNGIPEKFWPDLDRKQMSLSFSAIHPF